MLRTLWALSAVGVFFLLSAMLLHHQASESPVHRAARMHRAQLAACDASQTAACAALNSPCATYACHRPLLYTHDYECVRTASSAPACAAAKTPAVATPKLATRNTAVPPGTPRRADVCSQLAVDTATGTCVGYEAANVTQCNAASGNGGQSCFCECYTDDSLFVQPCVTDGSVTDSDGDGYPSSVDCDDNNVLVYPGAPELCDGLDNDCDTVVPANEADADGDGWSVCAGDCNDANDAVYPGAPELCDGLDNDCDGSLSSGELLDSDADFIVDCVDACPLDPTNNLSIDSDGDGVADCFDQCPGVDDTLGMCYDSDGDGVVDALDCAPLDATVYPGAPELCDGLDNNCDTLVPPNEADADGDGWRVCEGDCNDANALVYPGAPLQCGVNATVDADCSGRVDTADGDGDGYSECTGDCNDASAAQSPALTEVCDDGIDNDCDGYVDNCVRLAACSRARAQPRCACSASLCYGAAAEGATDLELLNTCFLFLLAPQHTLTAPLTCASAGVTCGVGDVITALDFDAMDNAEQFTALAVVPEFELLTSLDTLVMDGAPVAIPEAMARRSVVKAAPNPHYTRVIDALPLLPPVGRFPPALRVLRLTNFGTALPFSTLPTELPATLEELVLRNNSLRGTLPASWATLRVLDVRNNALNGSIPPAFTACSGAPNTSVALIDVSTDYVDEDIERNCFECPFEATCATAVGVADHTAACFNNLTTPWCEVCGSDAFAANADGVALFNLCVLPLLSPLDTTPLATCYDEYSRGDAAPLTTATPVPLSIECAAGSNNVTRILASGDTTRVTGRFPVNALYLATLRELSLLDTSLTGSLREAERVPTATLEVLRVTRSSVSGSIPASWFAQPLPSLHTLWLHNNALSGALPASLVDAVCGAETNYTVAKDVRLLRHYPEYARTNCFECPLPSAYDAGSACFHLAEYACTGDDGSTPVCGSLATSVTRVDDLCTVGGANDSDIANVCVLPALLAMDETDAEVFDGLQCQQTSANDVTVECGGAPLRITRLSVGALAPTGGSLPTALGLLTGLQRFDAVGKSMVGTLPTQLAALTALTHFDVSNNQLSGTIPAAWFAAWPTTMSTFDVGYNRLTGAVPQAALLDTRIYSSVFSIVEDNVMPWLRGNQFSCTAATYSTLWSTSASTAQRTEFGRVCAKSTPTGVYISYADGQCANPSLSRLDWLNYCWVPMVDSQNWAMHTFISTYANTPACPTATGSAIRGYITHEYPCSVGESNSPAVDFSGLSFSVNDGVPVENGDVYVSIRNLNIAGTIPDAMATAMLTKLPGLKTLRLYGCAMHGTLPASLSVLWNGGVPRALELDLSYNDLSGTIPAAWATEEGTLSGGEYMRSLVLSNNAFTGAFPTDFYNKYHNQGYTFPDATWPNVSAMPSSRRELWLIFDAHGAYHGTERSCFTCPGPDSTTIPSRHRRMTPCLGANYATRWCDVAGNLTAQLAVMTNRQRLNHILMPKLVPRLLFVNNPPRLVSRLPFEGWDCFPVGSTFEQYGSLTVECTALGENGDISYFAFRRSQYLSGNDLLAPQGVIPSELSLVTGALQNLIIENADVSGTLPAEVAEAHPLFDRIQIRNLPYITGSIPPALFQFNDAFIYLDNVAWTGPSNFSAFASTMCIKPIDSIFFTALGSTSYPSCFDCPVDMPNVDKCANDYALINGAYCLPPLVASEPAYSRRHCAPCEYPYTADQVEFVQECVLAAMYEGSGGAAPSVACNTTAGGWTLTCSGGQVTRIVATDLPSPRILNAEPLALLRYLPALWNIRLDAELDEFGGLPWSLSGTLPSTLAESTTLEVLVVRRHAHLSGTLPSTLASITALRWLDVSDNALSGSIDTAFFERNFTNVLLLRGNLFTGALPASVASSSVGADDLVYNSAAAHARSNCFTCPTPRADITALACAPFNTSTPWCSACTEAVALAPTPLAATRDLAILNYCVAPALVERTYTVGYGRKSSLVFTACNTFDTAHGAVYAACSLSSANIAGLIDTAVGAESLATPLAGVTLGGSLPSTLALLTALHTLRLRNGALQGTVPSELATMTSLRRVVLSNNALSGTLPSPVTPWAAGALVELLVQNNALRGLVPVTGIAEPSCDTLSLYTSFALLVDDDDEANCYVCPYDDTTLSETCNTAMAAALAVDNVCQASATAAARCDQRDPSCDTALYRTAPWCV